MIINGNASNFIPERTFSFSGYVKLKVLAEGLKEAPPPPRPGVIQCKS